MSISKRRALKSAERFASNDRRGRSMQNGENGVNLPAALSSTAPDSPLQMIANLTYQRNVSKVLDKRHEKG